MKHGIVIMTADNSHIAKLTAEQNILLTQFAAPTPDPKTYEVEIDGRNGTLEYTDLFGVTRFKNRPVTATLDLKKAFTHTKGIEYHSYLMNVFHGQTVKLYYWGHPDRYFYGRLSIGELTSGEFSISLNAEPFLYIAKVKEYTVTASETAAVLTVENRGKAVIPTLTIDGEILVVINGISQAFSTGEYKVIDFQLEKVGKTEITYSGSGTLKITYQERVL